MDKRGMGPTCTQTEMFLLISLTLIIIIIIIIIIIMAKNEYLMRHDKVCTHLHYSISKALGTETTDK